jgi:Leucine-rich repeat (LRR) protein
MAALGRCSHIEEIFVDVNECAIEDIDSIRHCTSLLRLTLVCQGLKSIAGLRYCTLLQRLSLHDCTQLVDVLALAWCTKLSRIQLHGCNRIKDISAIAECTSLKYLHVIGAMNLTGSETVLSNCTNLEILNLTKLTNE